jgi:hypothetical protein
MNETDASLSPVELQVSVTVAKLPIFSQLLQKGIILRREVGCSVNSFLREQLLLSSQFIEENIQTIFLNGRPVDDLETARVNDGCTLALSRAMPGLVGATMRRGGYYASLRAPISHSDEGQNAPSKSDGFITLKLFNLVADLLGKALLQDFFFLKRKDLADLASRWSETETESHIRATLDGGPVDWTALQADNSGDDLVLVRLKIV